MADSKFARDEFEYKLIGDTRGVEERRIECFLVLGMTLGLALPQPSGEPLSDPTHSIPLRHPTHLLVPNLTIDLPDATSDLSRRKDRVLKSFHEFEDPCCPFSTHTA